MTDNSEGEDCGQDQNDDTRSSYSTLTRNIAMQALELSLQEWGSLLNDDADEIGDEQEESLDIGVERVTSLFIVRLFAINAPLNTFSDLSTSTICRELLTGDTASDIDWSSYVSMQAIQETGAYVTRMLSLHRDLPFHNYMHAVHVCVSANKFLEFMLSRDFWPRQGKQRPPTFGLRSDSVALFALLFAALVHDVDHAGVGNRQRAMDEPQLALQYNDQSISENHSLHLAFSELLRPEYCNFYHALFPTEGDYHRCRLLVIQSVLSTDLASPERCQISNSKWKEAAFGKRQNMFDGSNYAVEGGRRGSVTSQISMHRANKLASSPNEHQDVRRLNRRGSNASISSIVSDVTSDSYNMLKSPTRNNHHNPIPLRRASNESIDSMGNFSDIANDSVAGGPRRTPAKPTLQRRLSSGSDYDSVAQRYRPQQSNPPARGVGKSSSGISSDSMAKLSHFAEDSMRLQQRQFSRQKLSRRQSTQSYMSMDTYASSAFQSVTANSIVLAQKKREFTGPQTRPDQHNDGDGDDYEDISDRSSDDEKSNKGPVRQPIQYEYNDADYDDDSSESLSLTPPSSDDEEPVIISGIPRIYNNPESSLSNSNHQRGGNQRRGVQKTHSIDIDATRPRPTVMRGVARRASTGNLTMRFGSLVGTSIDEHQVSEHNHTGPIETDFKANGHRRMSLNYSTHSSGPSQNFKKRLGIRRSMDLSGEAVEIYPRRGSCDMSVHSTFTEMQDTKNHVDYDEPDDLKAAVVIEVLLRAADVSHNMQYFENMTKWMSCLYKELLLAAEDGKGFDPRPSWFDNQCKVMEKYLLPLAAKLNEMGIFGSETGLSFSDILENNLDSWMVEGIDLQQDWNDGG
ncbi:hypothetical protein MPSEU_000406900 [Mayamaea pseudoterrestris]|nr:hypothetical protein MPSEU_000406900 [Mayamaea pseudoterrestris]